MIETPRLRLREFTREDLEPLAPMVADPEQMAFYPITRSRDEAAAWIEKNLRLYAERGFGAWLVEWRETGAFAGYAGPGPLTLDGVEEIEIGWHVHRTVWGQGVATEAAAAARDAAFERFGIPRLVAVVHPEHAASRRVAERIGMRVERETVLGDDYPALIYVLSAPG